MHRIKTQKQLILFFLASFIYTNLFPTTIHFPTPDKTNKPTNSRFLMKFRITFRSQPPFVYSTLSCEPGQMQMRARASLRTDNRSSVNTTRSLILPRARAHREKEDKGRAQMIDETAERERLRNVYMYVCRVFVIEYTRGAWGMRG